MVWRGGPSCVVGMDTTWYSQRGDPRARRVVVRKDGGGVVAKAQVRRGVHPSEEKRKKSSDECIDSEGWINSCGGGPLNGDIFIVPEESVMAEMNEMWREVEVCHKQNWDADIVCDVG